MAVDRVTIETVAYDGILLITLLQCNIYVTFKILINSVLFYEKHHQQNRKRCVIVCAISCGFN